MPPTLIQQKETRINTFCQGRRAHKCKRTIFFLSGSQCLVFSLSVTWSTVLLRRTQAGVSKWFPFFPRSMPLPFSSQQPLLGWRSRDSWLAPLAGFACSLVILGLIGSVLVGGDQREEPTVIHTKFFTCSWLPHRLFYRYFQPNREITTGSVFFGGGWVSRNKDWIRSKRWLNSFGNEGKEFVTSNGNKNRDALKKMSIMLKSANNKLTKELSDLRELQKKKREVERRDDCDPNCGQTDAAQENAPSSNAAKNKKDNLPAQFSAVSVHWIYLFFCKSFVAECHHWWD